MTIIVILLFGLLSYLIGSIPGGYLLTKLIRKEDIRDYGSKSTGATNTTRVLGLKLGIVAAGFDILKGIIVIIILSIINNQKYMQINNINILPLYGILAVFGHVFPVYLKFKGGKAVATSLGIVLFFVWPVGVIGTIAFIIFLFLINYVSVSSMLSALVILFSAIGWFYFFNGKLNITLDLETIITISILNIIIILRHSENIQRLVNGDEPRAIKKNK